MQCAVQSKNSWELCADKEKSNFAAVPEEGVVLNAVLPELFASIVCVQMKPHYVMGDSTLCKQTVYIR